MDNLRLNQSEEGQSPQPQPSRFGYIFGLISLICLLIFIGVCQAGSVNILLVSFPAMLIFLLLGIVSSLIELAVAHKRKTSKQKAALGIVFCLLTIILYYFAHTFSLITLST